MFVCFKDHTDINRIQFKHGTHFNWIDKFINSFHTGKCLNIILNCMSVQCKVFTIFLIALLKPAVLVILLLPK